MARPPVSQPDVLVWGATGAGVTAAVAAAGAGATVTLADPGDHVGGMVSGGLSWTDVGDLRAHGGLVLAFHRAVADHYGQPLFARCGPEPHVAEAILLAMLERSGVEVALGAALTGMGTGAGTIDEVRTGTARYRPAVCVDASYEGDLLAAAGVPYRVGREARDLHGERWAGVQPAYRPGKHNFPVPLSPWKEPAGELLPLVVDPPLDGRGWPDERLGVGDGGLQAYAFRVCLTDRAEHGRPIEEPAGYRPERFALLARYLEAVGDRLQARNLLGLVPDLLPGGKCDVNSIGPFSLNLLDGSNRRYPEGSPAERREIRDHHLAYTHQLLYHLRTDERVPPHIRGEMGRWWLCDDEFPDTDGWPHQLYIRDCRRMVGTAVVTEHHLLEPAEWPDAVAVGSYNIDIREVERTWRMLPEYEPTPAVFNEGYLSIRVPPYPIPYRALLPRPEDCRNLLVPVCCSASDVAFGSLRTEPTLMALGQAAGTAAALAAVTGIAPHDIDVDRLRQRLARDGQVIEPPGRRRAVREALSPPG